MRHRYVLLWEGGGRIPRNAKEGIVAIPGVTVTRTTTTYVILEGGDFVVERFVREDPRWSAFVGEVA